MKWGLVSLRIPLVSAIGVPSGSTAEDINCFLSFMFVSLNSSNINSSPAQLLHNQLWRTRIGPPLLYILSNSEIELVLDHDLYFF